MKKYLALVSALLVASVTFAPLTKLYALGEEPKAVVVTPEDAAKKYPMPKGKDYPAGINANKGSATASGFVQSPLVEKLIRWEIATFINHRDGSTARTAVSSTTVPISVTADWSWTPK
ncbi:MAG: hypothetical protein DMF73_19690 [Acidobacteria bacterium]|nr:MAG: hypothetical protein DMF73_19690 [Acidobacteriota bacterium]